jgi:hypothetical protein
MICNRCAEMCLTDGDGCLLCKREEIINSLQADIVRLISERDEAQRQFDKIQKTIDDIYRRL